MSAPSRSLRSFAAIPAFPPGSRGSPSTRRSAVETQLIPSASNAELKGLLQTGLKIFQGHQQHAEHVAADLKGE
jgi:hypothetical protein